MRQELIPSERIINKIYLIRSKKVMFDFDLAELYDVETKVLNQAVKRNKDRFPADFMFQLNEGELKNWRSQIVISNPNYKMGLRHSPYVFTEQGVAMLSSVLRSQRAIQVNIAIMRTFTKLREILLTHKELREKIEEMERKYDKNFKIVFDAIINLLDKNKQPIKEIGFKAK